MPTKVFKTILSTVSVLALLPVIEGNAAKIKIKTKVKANVQVSAPKVKPHVKVKIRKASPRIKVRVARKPTAEKPDDAEKVQPSSKSVTAAKKTRQSRPLAPTYELLPVTVALLPTPNPRKSGDPEQNGEFSENRSGSRLDHLADDKLAREAAEAAKALKWVADLGLNEKEFSLPSPDLAIDFPSNQDVLDGMFENGKNSKFGNSNIENFGPGNFVGLSNTHGQVPANGKGTSSADAAAGFWGVSQGRINSAIDGVANGGGTSDLSAQVTKTETDSGEVLVNKQYRDNDNESMHREQVQYHNNGQVSVEINERGDTGYSVGIRRTYTDNSRTQTVPGTGWDQLTTPDGYTIPAGGFDELRDPDSGYAGPSPFPWIKEDGPKTLRDHVTNGPIHVLTSDPDRQQGGQTNSTTAMVTVDDLLERYDPDTTHGTGGQKPTNLLDGVEEVLPPGPDQF